jgi:hypothetical protein
MSNSMKIRPKGAELFHADGHTHRQTYRYDEANSRFSQFCERAYKWVTNVASSTCRIPWRSETELQYCVHVKTYKPITQYSAVTTMTDGYRLSNTQITFLHLFFSFQYKTYNRLKSKKCWMSKKSAISWHDQHNYIQICLLDTMHTLQQNTSRHRTLGWTSCQ